MNTTKGQSKDLTITIGGTPNDQLFAPLISKNQVKLIHNNFVDQ
jgi:hypothetical protein